MSTELSATPTAATPERRAQRAWVNGSLVAADEARVSAIDHGLVAGGGVFEAFKVTTQGPFALTRHLDRLSRSAAALELPEPDHAFIRAGVEEVLADRDWDLGMVRLTYTGGVGPLGSQAAFGPPTTVLVSAPVPSYPRVSRIVTVPWVRNEHGAMTGIKTTSYAENIRALGYAHHRDASEGIFLNTSGAVCEGSGTNLFCVFGDEIVTSPLSSGALAGITRACVLDWIEVTERDLTLAEAQSADEVFITSSLRDVQGIEQWDDHSYPAMGPVTTRARAVFDERSAAEPDPV